MKILIIAGNTASGKSTVLDKLCESHGFEKVVTTTTREPRPGEVDGVHYNFINKDEFEKRISNDEFMEHVHAKGNYYGTEFKAFETKDPSKTPAVILDPEGCKNASDILKAKGLTPITVFIDESPETCIERVLSREANAAEKVKRMKDIREVEAGWSTYMNYDHKTKPLSTIEENCLDLKQLTENFQEYSVKKAEKRASKNQFKPS